MLELALGRVKKSKNEIKLNKFLNTQQTKTFILNGFGYSEQ